MRKYTFLFGLGVSLFVHTFCIASEEGFSPKANLIPLSPGFSSADPDGIWDPSTPPREWGDPPSTPSQLSLGSPASDKKEDAAESDPLLAAACIGSALNGLELESHPLAPPGLGFYLEDHGGIEGLELYKKEPGSFKLPSFQALPIFYGEGVLGRYPTVRGPIILRTPREEIVFCVGCHRFDITYLIACDTQDTFSQCLVLLMELETSLELPHSYDPYIALRKIHTELWNPKNLGFFPTFHHMEGRARVAIGHHEVASGNLEGARVHFFGAIQIAKDLKNEALFDYALGFLKSIL